MAKETDFEHPPNGHVGLLGYDSVDDDFPTLLVDSDGHLQIDVLTSGLPTGGATEATLAELSARVGNEISPASGTVNKQLADLLTELGQKLETADLASDTTRYINTLLHQYTGSAWVKSNLAWGYHDSYGEEVDETSVGAGSTVVVGATVPEGEVWKVEAIAIYHNDTVNREVSMNVNVNTENIGLNYSASLAPATRLFWNGAVTLAEDDYVRIVCVGLASGKYIRVQAVGYKMNIAM